VLARGPAARLIGCAVARHALLIGVSEFADARLARLNAPTNDVIALRSILQDSSRGSFDTVEFSVNEDFLAVRDHLSRFFHDRAPDDLLLLYYSGHGILGRGNRLFLATAGSNLDTPRDRSVSAKEIRDFIEDCRAERQIVVLDCCHSGAFAEHAKAAIPAPAVTSETFSGSDAGLYVLTAADALQFAWDGAELRAGNEAATEFSRFTSWLIDGLEKGEAAPEDEQITMDALYRYLHRRARSEGAASTPQRFVQGGVGDLVISQNPLAGSSQIDPGIMAALAAETFRMRMGAVAELALQMEEGRSNAARAARLILQRHLQRERDYQVRRAITKALAEELQHPAEAGPSAAEEKQRAEAVQLAEEEKQPAEAVQLAEEEKQRAEAAQRTERDKQRTGAARQAEEEKQRAEAARQAEEKKRRAEAARQAKEEKQRAEAARQAEEEKRRAEAARQAGEEKRRAEAARETEEEKRRADRTDAVGHADISSSGELAPRLSLRLKSMLNQRRLWAVAAASVIVGAVGIWYAVQVPGAHQASLPNPHPAALPSPPSAFPQSPRPGRSDAAENRVTELPDGLKYTDTKIGDGATAKAGNKVSVHYIAWLSDNGATGKKFDSSFERGQLQFTLGSHQIIAGLDEGVAGMKVGGKRTLIIPPKLGYGAPGAGGVIPPNATLIYDVELSQVQSDADENRVTEMPDGLKYTDTKIGDGATAKAGNKVSVHYITWLSDNGATGKKFDSSFERGQLQFTLGSHQVIAGLDEGVAGMKVGGKRTLIIPPKLGYGAPGAGGVIPPDATLIYDVELSEVQ
jgi:FKBP-type peptidyl-prolyl cis-trans isomerase